MKFEFKNIVKSFLPLLFLGLLITSCSKEDIEEPPSSVDVNLVEDITFRGDLGVFNGASGNGAGVDCDCYGPFDDIDWENSDPEIIEDQIEAALSSLSEEELEELFTPVCTESGGFYPNACFAECEGVTDYSVCENDDWGCDGDDFEVIECYEIVFPVTGVFEDGSTVTFNSYDEYFEAIILAEEEPQLVYPFDVTDVDGNITTVENADQWTELGVDCFGIGWEWEGEEPGEECFEIGFPFSLSVNGEIFTAADELALEEIFNDIFSGSEPPQELIIEPAYPMTLILQDGTEIVVNNDDEYFDAIVEHCD